MRRNESIRFLPDERHSRNVEERPQDPQCRQVTAHRAEREEAFAIRPIRKSHVHFLVQCFEFEIRCEGFSNRWIVEIAEGETVQPVQAPEYDDRPAAEAAAAVEDDDDAVPQVSHSALKGLRP